MSHISKLRICSVRPHHRGRRTAVSVSVNYIFTYAGTVFVIVVHILSSSSTCTLVDSRVDVTDCLIRFGHIKQK